MTLKCTGITLGPASLAGTLKPLCAVLLEAGSLSKVWPFLLNQSPKSKRYSCTCMSFSYSCLSLSSSTSSLFVTCLLLPLFSPYSDIFHLPSPCTVRLNSDGAPGLSSEGRLINCWLSGSSCMRASTIPVTSFFQYNVPLALHCLHDQITCPHLSFNTHSALPSYI